MANEAIVVANLSSMQKGTQIKRRGKSREREPWITALKQTGTKTTDRNVYVFAIPGQTIAKYFCQPFENEVFGILIVCSVALDFFQ